MIGPQCIGTMAVVLWVTFCCVDNKMVVRHFGPPPEPVPGQHGNYHWVTSVMRQIPNRCQAVEYPVIEADGERWRLFWWYKANTTWPASVHDILQDKYGDCDVDSPYCFSRLPEMLQENGMEILANDSAGTMYRWTFDSSNDIAHAAWEAFHDHKGTTKKNGNPWNPRVVHGNSHSEPQDSFQYKEEYGVKSLQLDDDNCDCDSTLSMGHAMCWATAYAFKEWIYGVDLLSHEGCSLGVHVPLPSNGLSLFFKDDDDCINVTCPNGFRCVDGLYSSICHGN